VDFVGEAVDVAVVGAGPAGVTAALYAKRKALSVKLFESEALGGQAAEAVFVENYPGIKGIKGFELMEKMRGHLKGFGIEPEEAAEVTEIKPRGKLFELEINDGEEKVLARSVILCTGSKYRMLNVPGEKELYGKGLSYCVTCDGPALKGKPVAVVGAGNSGATAALFLAEICPKVFLVEFLEKPAFDSVYRKPLEKAGVELVLNTEVKEVLGKKRVEGLKARERASGKERRLEAEGVMVYIGMVPKNALAKKLGLKLDEKGYVKAGEGNATSMKGVFAAGDITGELAQIVVAAGSGAVAATAVFDYLKGLK
jgi:thioredoxin reductase (NADPH)